MKRDSKIIAEERIVGRTGIVRNLLGKRARHVELIVVDVHDLCICFQERRILVNRSMTMEALTIGLVGARIGQEAVPHHVGVPAE